MEWNGPDPVRPSSSYIPICPVWFRTDPHRTDSVIWWIDLPPKSPLIRKRKSLNMLHKHLFNVRFNYSNRKVWMWMATVCARGVEAGIEIVWMLCKAFQLNLYQIGLFFLSIFMHKLTCKWVTWSAHCRRVPVDFTFEWGCVYGYDGGESHFKWYIFNLCVHVLLPRESQTRPNKRRYDFI